MGTSSNSYQPFATFALIWSVTTLAHQLAFTFWAESWQGWVFVTTAVAVLFRPSCTLRFALLLIASLLNLWNKLPFVPNHILYEGMLHLTMLLAASLFFLRGSTRQHLIAASPGWKPGLALLIVAVLAKVAYFVVPMIPKVHPWGPLTTLFLVFALGRLFYRAKPVEGGDAYLASFAPVIRASVVVMYFWAGIQKLNWDYLDPEISCAANLHTEIAAYFGGMIPTQTWSLHFAIWGSYAFEFGIPLLLLFRRTRYCGLAAAVLFHLWLSIHPAAGIFSYSSLILGLLILFFPFNWGQALQHLWDRQLLWLGRGDVSAGRNRARWLVVLVFFATLIGQGSLYLSQGRNYEVFQIANRIGFFSFFAWGLWISACFLIAGWRARRDTGSLPGRDLAPTGMGSRLVWVGLIPVLLNGMIPWVGGRTQTSFSMYSNLRSEGEGNHLFLRRMDLFDFQTDFVEVVESVPDLLAPEGRPRGIQQFANPGHRFIPWFEFQRLVSEMADDFEVVYRRGDETLALGRRDGDIHGDESAFTPHPLLLRKLLWFRRHDSLEGPMRCTH